LGNDGVQYGAAGGAMTGQMMPGNGSPPGLAGTSQTNAGAGNGQQGGGPSTFTPTSTVGQMQGLVNSFMNLGSQIQAPVIGGSAAVGQVNGNQLVSNQLNDLLSQDSPLMQRAQAHAMEMANNRGLVNSSMAAQAGQSAMIDAATPIAQGNANTYLQHSLADQSAANQMAMTNVSAQNQAAIARMQSQYGLLGQGMSSTLYGVQSDANRALQSQQMQMNQNQFNASLDNSQFNQYGNWMQQVLMNPNMDQTGKQNAMDWINARYGMPMGGSGNAPAAGVGVDYGWLQGGPASAAGGLMGTGGDASGNPPAAAGASGGSVARTPTNGYVKPRAKDGQEYATGGGHVF